MTIQYCAVLLLPVALLFLAGSSPVVAQLELGYYSKTCPNVEALVRDEMEKIISAAPSLAGPLRLHFHDCFVRVSRVFSVTLQTYFRYYCLNVYTLCVLTFPLIDM